ncbi:MAG: ABC transporter permease subunit [Thermoproteota archaeon]
METIRREKLQPMKRILIIARKEFSDAVISKRLWLLIALFLLFYVTMTFYLSVAYSIMSEETRPTRITQIFSSAGSSVSLIAPFLGIAFGYDAVSRERESGTLRILLSRPVYREDVVNGKIIASLAIMGITLFASTFLTVPATIFLHGITIDLDDIARLFLFSTFSLMFAFAYYALSLFLSTLLNKSSLSLMASIALWAFFTIIMPIISTMIAFMMLGFPSFANAEDYFKKYSELNYMIQIFSINNHYNTLTGPVLTKGSKQDVLNLIKVFSQYPISIMALILYPIIFIMLSYIMFTRREEK